MEENLDENFYIRADEHINLSNQQLSDIGPGKVSASMMFALARFNAWRSAIDYDNQKELKKNKKKKMKYFVEQYRIMLEDNLDDYIANFEQYMQVNEGDF